jgi:hypothetical protein
MLVERRVIEKQTGKPRKLSLPAALGRRLRFALLDILKDEPSACSVCPPLDGGLVVKRARLLLHPIKQTARHNVRAIPNQATGSGERGLGRRVRIDRIGRLDQTAKVASPSSPTGASREVGSCTIESTCSTRAASAS